MSGVAHAWLSLLAQYHPVRKSQRGCTASIQGPVVAQVRRIAILGVLRAFNSVVVEPMTARRTSSLGYDPRSGWPDDTTGEDNSAARSAMA
jgi:hypothetical protein